MAGKSLILVPDEQFAMYQAAPKMLAMLRKCEYANDGMCPFCGIIPWKKFHKPDCELAALLKEADG